MARFLNPYNFVRPLPAPRAVPDDDPELHLLWRCPPPPHDRYTGISGRITCSITVQTPLFINDSVEIEPDQENPEHKIFSFFQIDGREVIPGSSLRGAVRSVFEAATNSSFGIFTSSDQPLFYRNPPEVALGLVPARVELDKQSKACLRLLPGMLDIQIPSKNLYAAWIPSYRNEDRLRHPDERKHRHVLTQNDLVKVPNDCRDGSECWGAVRKTGNRDKGFPHWQVDIIRKEKKEIEQWAKSQRGDYTVVRGYVYSTGLNMDVKQYERFFFEKPGRSPVYAEIKRSVAERYNALIDDYADRAEEIQNSLESQSANGRKLKLSNFIRIPNHLTKGTLVYADLRQIGPGRFEARALYPVNVSRAAYQRSVRALLDNDEQRHLLPCTDIKKLCLASRVFGWVREEAGEHVDQQVAYAGRVRFSHAAIDPEKRAIAPEDATLQILGTPHSTAVEFYLELPDSRFVKPSKDKGHGYDAPGARLRGRKFYRHHPNGPLDEETITDERTKFNRTLHGVVLPDSVFHFTIDFENLQPVELGALLWSLTLNDGTFEGFHRLGYAKPLGFGSVVIDVTSLNLIDHRIRYNEPESLVDHFSSWAEYPNLNMPLITRFQDAMGRLYGQSFHSLMNICDLQALLGAADLTPDVRIHYPRLKRGEVKDQFQWFVQNKKSDRPKMLPTPDADQGFSYGG